MAVWLGQYACQVHNPRTGSYEHRSKQARHLVLRRVLERPQNLSCVVVHRHRASSLFGDLPRQCHRFVATGMGPATPAPRRHRGPNGNAVAISPEA